MDPAGTGQQLVAVAEPHVLIQQKVVEEQQLRGHDRGNRCAATGTEGKTNELVFEHYTNF